MTENISPDVQAIIDENNRQLALPVKRKYIVAAVGSKTRDGGTVTRGICDEQLNGVFLACVGDMVRYADGRTAIIVDGAGYGFAYKKNPCALVGSHLDNGDEIVSSPDVRLELVEREGEPAIPGLLDRTWKYPA